MKFFKYVLSVLILLSGYAQAFTLSESFDSGGAGWGTSVDTGTSAFTINSDGSGKHLQAKVVRDVNDGTGRYTKALGSMDINDVNDSIFLEADVQVVDGFNNFGSVYLGLGKSGDNFKNQLLARLYWDGTTGDDLYGIYGAIYDSNSDTNRPPLSVTGVNKVGMAGFPCRIKAKFSHIIVDDVNRLSYDAKVYRINANGSTGSLVGETNAVQTDGLASLEVNQVGIFITNAAKASITIGGNPYYRSLTANIDNVYVSDANFNPSPVLPSWYNFTAGDTDIYETFTTDPNSSRPDPNTRWTKVAPAASGCSFTWTSRASDGFMDVVLTRRPDSNDNAKAAQFYRSLGTEFFIDNSDMGPELYGIYWFTEFDVYIVDMDGFAEGLIGTGYTWYGQRNDLNILAGAYYGAQELGNGIRATLVGYGDTAPAIRRAVTVQGLLMPGNTYRMKCAAAQRYDSLVNPAGRRTRMIGALYKINPDGTDGNLVATGAEWQSVAGSSLYADIMGIFSTFQTTTIPRTMHIYVDNVHFSDVGFKLDGVKPTWFNAIPCNELPPQISGDAGGPAGKGKYDCAVDVYDLKYLAEDWLKIGN